jgi:hypothetical protein
VFPYSSHLSPAGMTRRLLCSGSVVVFAGIAISILAGLSTAPAQAAASTGTCPGSTLSQPFLKWGDANFYELLAGADFEGTLSGWTLSHGAQKATGSEPYGATGTVGAWSLALEVGAAAQSPFTCVTASTPSFRFFARNEGPSATVLVEVVYKTPFRNVSVPVGAVTLKSGWQPAPSMPTEAATAGALSSNGTAQMALRFVSTAGASRIDDVLIDPRMR